jgi:hypothetical protein
MWSAQRVSTAVPATEPEVPCSILDATKFSENSGSETGSTLPREDNCGVT